MSEYERRSEAAKRNATQVPRTWWWTCFVYVNSVFFSADIHQWKRRKKGKRKNCIENYVNVYKIICALSKKHEVNGSVNSSSNSWYALLLFIHYDYYYLDQIVDLFSRNASFFFFCFRLRKNRLRWVQSVYCTEMHLLNEEEKSNSNKRIWKWENTERILGTDELNTYLLEVNLQSDFFASHCAAYINWKGLAFKYADELAVRCQR